MPQWRLPWLAFLLALGLSYLLTPLVSKLAMRFGAVAVPRERDVHKKPLPRWGGLAMFGAFVITLGSLYVYHTLFHADHPWTHLQVQRFVGVLTAATVVAVVGVVDDKWEVSAIWQSLALVGAGLILVAFDVRIDGITNPFAASSLPPPRHGADPAKLAAVSLRAGRPLRPCCGCSASPKPSTLLTDWMASPPVSARSARPRWP